MQINNIKQEYLKPYNSAKIIGTKNSYLKL